LSFVLKAGASWPLVARGDGRPIAGLAVGVGILAGALAVGVEVHLLLLLGAAVISLVGLLDDWRGLSPWEKLLGQAAAAGLAAAALAPLRLSFFGRGVSLGPAARLVTFVWVLTLPNAVNLVDGLDGLALTIVVSPFACLVAMAVSSPGHVGLAAGAGVVGALVALAPLNLLRGRLLLGDAGAELLGYVLAILSLLLPRERGDPGALAVVPALLLAAVPLSDTVFAVLRRLAHGQSILRGDEGHIHHRLARRVGSRKAVLVLGAASLLSALAGGIVWRIGA